MLNGITDFQMTSVKAAVSTLQAPQATLVDTKNRLYIDMSNFGLFFSRLIQ